MATVSPSLATEKGHAVGLGWADGLPWDPSELSPELAWPLSVRIFDKMRTQDSKVSSVLRAITLPIRRTRWAIDPAGASDEVVAHVQGDLRLPLVTEDQPPPFPGRIRGKFRWAEHLRLALLELPLGHMFFEQVYEIRDGKAHLARLAERLPSTIAKINVARTGDLTGIEQYPTGMPGDTGPFIKISADRLVAYCNDREGGNWQGRSIFRSCYSDWMIKERLKRVLAMSDERTGMGVPMAKAAEGMTQTQINDLVKLAQGYRAGESSGGALPYGADVVLKGVEGTLPDILSHIRYFDQQIASSMLQEFRDLGQTPNGSRALGETMVDFFVLALQAVADDIAVTATAEIVEDLVDLNWGPEEPAPRIVVGSIADEQELTAEALQRLIASGAVQADDELEDYVRQHYRLPARGTNPRQRPTSNNPVLARRGKVAAGSTPATVRTWSGWKLDRRLVAHYKDELAQAFAGAIDVADVVASYKSQVKAAADPQDIERARSLLSASADLTEVSDAAADMYGAGYVAGARAGRLSIGGVETPEWEADIDWSKWTPGDLEAAAELAGEGRGLAALLSDADVTIKSVADGYFDRMAESLAEGVANGDSINTIATSLKDLLSDPDRAEMIANTEVARAMTVATADTYAENGVSEKEFLTDSDPCPDCEENEQTGAIALDDEFPNGDPPVHPNCQCALLPVVGDSANQEAG